jgi:hypothetical protein
MPKGEKTKLLWQNPDYRKYMSEARIGRITWNKGKKTGLIPKSAFKPLKQHPYWQGGKSKDNLGYIRILKPNHPNAQSKGYIYEHRLIIETQIGRYLYHWEISHHINHIKYDNRPENLMLFKGHSAHHRFEIGKIVKLSEIIFDGSKKKKG